MTNKEAIQILKTSAWLREDEERSTKRHMAIDMAIEALSCSEIPNGSDAVSRQAAIDAVQNEVEPFVVIEPGTNCVIGAGVKDEDVIRVLEHLPSAEPETAKKIVGKSKNGITLWYQCEKCNKPVDESDMFCSECGRRLVDECTC